MARLRFRELSRQRALSRSRTVAATNFTLKPSRPVVNPPAEPAASATLERRHGGCHALRGIDVLSAMIVLSELGDLRRFTSAPQLMAAVGLVPREYGTGDKTRRFGITKTGNAHVRHRHGRASRRY